MKRLFFIILALFSLSISNAQYCIKRLPNYSFVYITRFQLETIDKPSGNSAYSDFTSLNTDLKIGDTYIVTVNSVGSSGQNGRIYIDWNQDNSFNIIDCSRKKQAPTEQRKNFFERLFDW